MTLLASYLFFVILFTAFALGLYFSLQAIKLI